jgi:hypothetical protein
MTSRQTALGGALFVPAYVVGLALVNNPDLSSTPAAFARYYASSGNRAHLIAAAVLLAVSALLWVVFAIGLRERLAETTATRLAAAGTVATAALIGVAGTLISAIPFAMTFSSAPAPGVDLERYLPIAGYLALTVFGMPMAALTIGAVCVASLRQGALPRWLAWSGIGAAILLVGSVEFFPMVALVLWVAASCVVLSRRPLRIPLPTTP